MPQPPDDLKKRIQELADRSEQDRDLIRTLQKQVAALEPKKPSPPAPSAPKQEPTPQTKRAAWRAIFDVVLFALGSVGTFMYVSGEFGWHWLIALLLAPIGGAVVYMLGKAGVTI